MQTGSALEAGTILGGDFEVVRLLGSGGMGAVYVVEQRSTSKQRALKVMHRDVAPDAEMQRRFEQEARVGAQIKSGHVVDVVAAGLDAPTGLPYLVMDLLDGVDLATHARLSGPLLLFEVYGIFEQLCHGMAAAHAVGIVHRDLKPENIFLARTNQAGSSAPTVKILDFGIAKHVSEIGTNGTAAIGSPLWMAPEQTEPGPVTPAADVWALGLLAYYLLAGPFWRSATAPTATPMHVLREIVLEPIPLASERGGSRIPPGFDAWFARCLVRDPKARFADAGEAWRAMQRFCAPAGLSIPPEARGLVSASGRPVSFGPEALAETSAAGVTDEDRASLRTQVDAPAAPFAPAAAPAMGALTPKATLPPAPRSPWPLVSAGLALAVAVLVGMKLVEPRTLPSPSSAPPSSGSPGEPPPRDGFTDPTDGVRQGTSLGTTMPVREHHVRLLTRVVTNASNVADSVVRGAIDWSSWEYLRCYDRTYGASRELPSGTITVAFDILDQLPRHATLEASTFGSAEMEKCVVGTVSAHTMNAARSSGVGHVVYGFKFLGQD